MRYVLGIESGKAGLTAVVADETGCLLGSGQSCIHARNEADAMEWLPDALAEASHAAIARADLENARITCVCLGLNAIPPEVRPLLEESLCWERLISRSAAQVALAAVTLGQPGVVVLAGRNAIAYGVDTAGREASAGGWSSVVGDAGSGYWIALRALNACCRALDGIARPTQILPLLLQHLEAQDLQSVHEQITSRRLTMEEIAALSEIVYRAGLQGDSTARSLLREAGKELALTANAVLARLQIDPEAVTVGTVGGVFRAGRLVLRTFREVIKRVTPHAVISPCRVPPAVGAALLALKEVGCPLDAPTQANVIATLPRLSVRAESETAR